ncbi:Hpt domain-containing protein, partial [Aquisalimonas sp.]|uniref:Hpt domain-containing protein n=1 Tax=Aquisalimonas sp. TaxID=1872621 RepID=UPI0025C24D52
MNHALCAGLPLELVEWLNRRLPGLQAVGTAGAREARELLVQGDWALLVVDHDLGSHGGEPLVRAARGLSPVLPVVYCLDPIDAPELVKPLVRDLAVNRVLFRPLDREELAIAAARLVGVELPGVCPRTKSEEQLAAGVAALWQRARPSIAERIALLDEAVSALAAGVLPRERREQAQREAHKIAGSVGTFGFTIATYHARLLERLLAVDQPGGEDVRIAALHVSELRRVLTQHAAEPTVQSPDAGTKTTVLLVDADATLRGAVAEALRARSVEAAGVAGADEALRVIEGGSAPELAVVGNPATGERSALLAA